MTASSESNGRRGTHRNQSVERAISLLSCFSEEEPSLTLAEITERVGTGKATTHRYATVLREQGMLRYNDAEGVYTLGPRIVELAAVALAGLRVIKVAGPHMERLLTDVNETVVLSVWDGDRPVVVRVDDRTDRIVRLVVQNGTRLPLSSSQGKVFLAFQDGTERSGSGVSREELESVRRHGIAINSQVVQGFRAIAAPVFQDREITATLAIVGTTSSVADDPDSPQARAVRDAAARLSAELGFVRSEGSRRADEGGSP